jgi:hypothetical protein
MARDHHSDAELRALYDQLRCGDVTRTPSAESMLFRAKRAAPPRRFAPIRLALPLAAAATLVLVIANGRESAETEFRNAVEAWTEQQGTWRSPTDFLLDLPGRELLSTAPRIGHTSPWSLPTPVDSASGDDT